jgi:Tol biopolymer transport system component
MFAEGTVSTNGNEFGGVFTPDGKEFYFTKSVPQSYLYMICVSRLKDEKWSEPEAAPFSGRYRDFDAVISPDGSKLFFVSDRPVPGEYKTDYDIWYVERKQYGWSEPTNLSAPINTDAWEWFASVTRDGTLYFAADRSGGFRNTHIYRSRFVNGRYAEPEKLSEAINSESIETEPYISPDESFLLFSSYGRLDGSGDWDIYISYNQNGKWTKARNLGPKVNTSARDYSPRLTPDGKYLFFTSERSFATKPLQRALSYQELVRNLRGVLNGNGNIYQISLSALKAES